MQKGIANNIAFQLRAYTKKELCILYDIQPYTLRKWLKEIPETADTGRKNYLDVVQVEALLKAKGVPGEREFK